MIRSIRVSNIGSLVAFDNKGSEFSSKKSVVHGLNGSGKSQLCALMKRAALLRTEERNADAKEGLVKFAKERISKEATSTRVELSLDETTISIRTDINEVGVTGNLPHLHVFNEEYLTANIGLTVYMPERQIRIGEVNKERDELEAALKKQRQSLSEVDRKIEELIGNTREETGYPTQKRTSEIICREAYLAPTNPANAHPTAREELEKLADPPDRISLDASHLLPYSTIDCVFRAYVTTDSNRK